MSKTSTMRVTLERLLTRVKRDVGLELRVCMPAHVIEYIPPIQGARPTPPRVRVRIDLLYARDARAGDANPSETYVADPNPKLIGEALGEYAEGSLLVPVHFPGPWGMWSCGPLMPGEQGKLVWCDRSIDSWQIDGGPEPIDPVFGHTHGGGLDGGPMNDAWFEPGVRSGKGLGYDPASNIPTDAWRIGTGDGAAGMTINMPTAGLPLDLTLQTSGATLTLDAATSIKVGANAVSFAAKADLVEANLNTVKTAMTLIPAAVDPASAVTAVNAILTFFKSNWISSVAASIARVE